MEKEPMLALFVQVDARSFPKGTKYVTCSELLTGKLLAITARGSFAHV